MQNLPILKAWKPHLRHWGIVTTLGGIQRMTDLWILERGEWRRGPIWGNPEKGDLETCITCGHRRWAGQGHVAHLGTVVDEDEFFLCKWDYAKQVHGLISLVSWCIGSKAKLANRSSFEGHGQSTDWTWQWHSAISTRRRNSVTVSGNRLHFRLHGRTLADGSVNSATLILWNRYLRSATGSSSSEHHHIVLGDTSFQHRHNQNHTIYSILCQMKPVLLIVLKLQIA